MIAQELLEKEVLFKDDLVRLIGKRPFKEEDPYETTPDPTPNGNGVDHPKAENGKDDSPEIVDDVTTPPVDPEVEKG